MQVHVREEKRNTTVSTLWGLRRWDTADTHWRRNRLTEADTAEFAGVFVCGLPCTSRAGVIADCKVQVSQCLFAGFPRPEMVMVARASVLHGFADVWCT